MSIVKGLISGNAEYEIAKSLRFRGSANAYVTRSVPVAGNRKTWTWSGWVKRGLLSSSQIFFAAGGSSSNRVRFYFNDDDTFSVFNTISNSNVTLRQTTAKFRDPFADIHIVVAWDSTQATANDRLKVYINGSQVTSFSVTNNVGLNNDGWVFSAAPIYLGHSELAGTTTSTYDGLISEFYLIEGLALGPGSFGYLDTATNSWRPKKYTGVYGANGSYLPFDDGTSLTTLGKDRSGNGNDWTFNGISLTAGATYDWMDDTPTNNYCTWNPLVKRGSAYGAATYADGNLKTTSPSGTGIVGTAAAMGTVAAPSGKFYFEVTPNSANALIGIASDSYSPNGTNEDGLGPGAVVYCGATGNVFNNSVSSSAFGATYSTETIGVAVDIDARKVWFSKAGVWQASGDPSTGANGISFSFSGSITPIAGDYVGAGSVNNILNCGQLAYTYTPPAGFKALCTKNLPEPGVVAKNPKKHFDIALNTGGNIKTASEELFPSNFLEWIKDRGAANNHQLIDIVRGTSAVLQSNTTAAETTYVAPSSSSVGWVWKAGGAPVANTAGSISSQVSANVDAGFSIVTYTGNGIDGATVGHGLGVVPKMVIVKAQNNASNWRVFHSSLNASNNLYLNSPNAQDVITTTTGGGIGTSPSSSVFTCVSGAGGNINNSNAATWTYVAYCFTKVPGFSKLGSYTGNGLADGPFVYCGFRPRFLMAKRADTGTENWVIIDTARDVINVAGTALFPNLNNGESVLSPPLDICSNGFKIRAAASGLNTSGATYIFYAIADQTLKYSNAR